MTLHADCQALLFVDPGSATRGPAVGVAHAGWRGTVGKIAAETVRTMTEAYGTDPGDVVAGIGPSIGPCCYEVGSDVIEAWQESEVAGLGRAVRERGTEYHFDLWAANRLVLVQAGVPDLQIEYSAHCVRCQHERFFSYRATRQIGASPGRNLMVAQLLSR